MFSYISHKPKLIHYIFFFIAAFTIRATLFMAYIGPHRYYIQPDSGDYHIGALCIATGNGMFRPDIKQPIFWRTPGYSYFLHFFYTIWGFNDATPEGAKKPIHAALWAQIFINAFIPLILFALAYLLTQSYIVAWLVAGISIIHPGFILASDYLLSEGPSLIFFFIFLYALFTLILKKKYAWMHLILAVVSLSIYTWIRPMGQWVGIITALIIFTSSSMPFKKRFITSFIFIFLFLGSLSPWYIRNYHYTHELFFNPTLGPYLNCFCVPKILRRMYTIPLEKALTIAQRGAAYEVEKRRRSIEHLGLYTSQESCKKYAFPIITKHLNYFIYDWIIECIKTTFDLYSYQLVALATNTYTWDPIEEYLPEKLAQTLWKATIPFRIRIIGWIELLWMITLWIGLIIGLWKYFVRSVYQDKKFSPHARIWLAAFLLSGATIGMTGGFGYARLRLPIEPLLIILGLMGIISLLQRKKS